MPKTMLLRAPMKVYQEACRIASRKGLSIAHALGYSIESMEALIKEKDKEIASLRKELEKKPKTVTKTKTVEKTKIVREKIREFNLGTCQECGRSFHWNLDRSEDYELLEKAIDKAKYIHTDCG